MLPLQNKRIIRENKKTQTLVPIYYGLFKSKLAQGQISAAQYYFNQYDSLRIAKEKRIEKERVILEKGLVRNILESQLAVQTKENEMLTEKNSHLRLRILLTGVIFISIIIFIVYYLRKRNAILDYEKKIVANQLEISQLEEEKARIELQFKNSDLTNFGLDIVRKKEVLEEVKSQVKSLKKEIPDAETAKSVDDIVRYISNNTQIDEQRQNFQENVEEINERFMSTLQKRYPNLTQLDIYMCGLIRLGLTNKDIASMRNVSYKAARMARYRIRKKLNLPEEVDMVDFLKNI